MQFLSVAWKQVSIDLISRQFSKKLNFWEKKLIKNVWKPTAKNATKRQNWTNKT